MKKIFYWRFSRKIEGEFWIFYKRFPWEKNWMEEILKGFLWKIEAGFTPALVLHVLYFPFKLSLIPAIDLLPPCLCWSRSSLCSWMGSFDIGLSLLFLLFYHSEPLQHLPLHPVCRKECKWCYCCLFKDV